MQKLNNELDIYFEEFMLEKTMKGLAVNTLKTYRERWRKFTLEMNINKPQDITQQVVRQYAQKLIEKNLSPHTINSDLRNLQTILNWMSDVDQAIIAPVRIKKLKAKIEIKEVFSDPELARMARKPSQTADFSEWRAWMTCTILMHTGMRGATLRRLRWTDLDLTVKTATLDAKTGSRLVPLCDELLSAFMAYRRKWKMTEGFVICQISKTGNPLPQYDVGSRTLLEQMQKFQQLRMLDTTGLHQFRRTFITNALAKGVDSILIARMVGHDDLQMIQKYYAKHSVDHLRKIFN